MVGIGGIGICIASPSSFFIAPPPPKMTPTATTWHHLHLQHVGNVVHVLRTNRHKSLKNHNYGQFHALFTYIVGLFTPAKTLYRRCIGQWKHVSYNESSSSTFAHQQSFKMGMYYNSCRGVIIGR